jgi:hypothetical protein
MVERFCVINLCCVSLDVDVIAFNSFMYSNGPTVQFDNCDVVVVVIVVVVALFAQSNAPSPHSYRAAQSVARALAQ